MIFVESEYCHESVKITFGFHIIIIIRMLKNKSIQIDNSLKMGKLFALC